MLNPRGIGWRTCLLAVVWAHLWAFCSARDAAVDAALKQRDALVLSAYRRAFTVDYRYEAVLTRVSRRLNPHLAEVFAGYGEGDTVTWHVFASRMGFNAQTWHRIILVDSLLLDGLRALSQGLAMDPSFESAYVKRLAFFTAGAHAERVQGHLKPDRSNPANIYNLPRLWGLPPSARDEADACFEGMVAGWMAHEVAHAYLGHTRQRYEAMLRAEQALSAESHEEAIAQVYSHALSYRQGRENERAADAAAALLLTRAGYSVEPMVASLIFCEMLERWMGKSDAAVRTHPDIAERVRTVRAAAAATSTPAPPLPPARP